HLKETLPEYMVPAYFVELEKMPLTANGKLNRRALPEPNLDASLVEYEAPRNKVEETLAKIWSKILGIEKVGINDNFFDLGGHSLKATMLMSKIHKELNREVPLKELFKSPTIKDLSKYIESAEENLYSKIEKVEEKEYYEASSAQKRMYMLQQFDKDSTAYNMPIVFELEGKVDKNKIEKTFRKLTERHDALRTYFKTLDGQIIQKLQTDYKFQLAYSNENGNIEDIIRSFVQAFDLEKAPLFRVELVKSKEKGYLLIDMHHIISDGISMSILIDEFTKIYSGKILEPLRLQYKDFAVWQNSFLKSEEMKKQEEYWINRFSDEIPVLNMPIDYERPAMQSFEGDSVSFELSEDTTLKLRKLTKETGTTMHMALLSAFNILLSKYSGQEDIVIGTPIAGRAHADLQNIVGMFVNTLALRNKPEGDKKYVDFLKEVKENSLKAYENQSYQFEALVEKLDIRRDTSRNPLFDVIFNMVDKVNKKYIKLGDVVLKQYNSENKVSKCDLTLSSIENDKKLSFTVDYSSKLFNKDTIKRLSIHYIKILESITNNNGIKLSEISLISEQEKNKILYEFNNTKIEYSKYKTIQQIFEIQVEKTPNNIAVVFGNDQITYKELNEKSNQLARELSEKGVGPNRMVGVMLNRSIDMIIGILGIIKAGGAYLPIEPSYPEDRIKYMLENSKAKVLVTRDSYININHLELEKIYIDNQTIYLNDYSNLENSNESHDLAYTIYTSGSTGNPKGVMITHEAVINTIQDMNAKFRINEKDRIIGLSSVCFDLSVYDIFGSLSTGATLVEVSDHRNVIEISNILKTQKITVWNSAPAIMDVFIESIEEPFHNEDLRLVLLSGDWISLKLPQKIKKYFSNPKVVSLGGATEASIWSIYYPIEYVKQEWKSIPYGMPLANQTFYVLDKSMNLCPYGVPGELYIGGIGVAKGYMNDLEKTRKAFISHNILGNLYRTGDWGRFNENGYIEFLGRVDNQAKIRGFRIELGEIENNLLKINGIKEALVLAKENDVSKYLCAYYVGEKAYNVKELRKELEKALPEYMIPPYFIKLENIPLTPNGKIDRKALAKVDLSLIKKEYVAPKNEVQEQFVAVIGSVLGLDKVSIKDSFFDIGGDSIKAIQVASRLRKYEINVEVKDILASKNIEMMAKCIKVSTIKAEQDVIEGEVIPTPIQKEFIEIQDKAYKHFNQALMVYSKEGFDEEILKAVMTKIIGHHDALRMVIRKEHSKYSLYNRGLDGNLYDFYKFNYENMEEKDLSEIINKEANNIQASMDLENGPLVKVALFKTKEGDHLLMAIHHHVVDGVSWRIILEDLSNGYKALKEGEKVELPSKTTSFKEWSEKQYEYSNSKKLLKELKYWKEVTDKSVEQIPRDKEIKGSTFKDKKNIIVKLNTEDTKNLLKESNRAYNTEINDILIGSLGIAARKWKGLNNLAITLEGHGREDILKDVDITRTIGWFTTTYPVVLDLNQENIGKSIKKTKEILRKVPDKGIGYGILKQLTSCKNKNNEEMELKTDIGFNYLGQFDEDTNNEVFKNSNMPTGNSLGQEFKLLNSIEINSMISDGELNIDISYNSLEYNESSIENFGDLYKQSLITVVKHCMEKEETEYIGVDYGVNEYSIEEIDELKNFVEKEIGENIVVEKINKLTPMQEGMLFTYLQNKETTAYVLQLEFDIEGEIKLDLLNKAYNELLKRHEALRTIIYQNNLHTAQVTLKNISGEVEYEDFSNLDNKNETIEKYKKNKIKAGFNIFKDVLFKLTLIKEEDNKYKLLINSHHIIVDGWSNQIIIGELLNIYKILKSGEKLKLEKSYNYDEYIKWLDKQDKEEALENWKSYLEGYDTTLTLPDEAKIEFRKEKVEYEEENLSLKLEKNVLNKLRGFASKYRVTIGVICSTVLGITLQKYNNTDDVVFGTVVSGRPSEIEGIENTVGIFINSIPVRINTKENESFVELVTRVQNESNKLKSYEYMSLADIQNLTISKQNLIKYLMVFENYPASETEENKLGFKINAVDGREQTDYDFNISFVEEEGLLLRAMVNKNIYNESFVNKFLKEMVNILEVVVENNEVLIKDIDILDEKEKQVLLKDFNDTKAEYPRDKSVKELFEEVVNESGDNIALSSNGIDLTYKELNEKANKIANFLIKKGTMNDNIIGILCDRSIETIVAILGVVKAGAAYMPIDKEYPKERIKYMLKDSKSNILLGQKNNFGKLNLEDVNVEKIYIESEEIKNESIENPDIIILPEDLIYVIYTSGSTGRPKGVAVEHRGVVSLVKNTNHTKFREGYKYLKNISMSFDPSVLEIWGTLLNKMTLVVIKKEITMDIDKLGEIIQKENIKVMNLPAPLFNSYGMEKPEIFKGIECLQTGGDVISAKAVSMVLKEWNGISIVNGYGPTENTVTSTAFIINNSWDDKQEVPIGKPVSNSTAYIMDKNNKLLPIGVVGELCVGGDGVARGYLNREKLTRERFILNPYVKGERIYKTGDFAKMLPDGNIKFLGRMDNQVKIRGYRIELGEIEKEILKNEEIKEVIVLDRKDQSGSKYICAYVVAKSGLNLDKIKEDIANELPIYMVPSYIIQLDSMPLTQNGKIDKKALPEVDITTIAKEYIAPRNEMEEKICKIYSEVLGIEKISIRDDFFDIGGHSLKAINVVSRLQKELKLKVEVSNIFTYSTVEKLSEYLNNVEEKVEYIAIEKAEEKEYYKASLVQKRMYAINQMDKESINYNMPNILATKGSFDKEKIETTLNKIIERHEVFRTGFHVIDGELVQKINEDTDLNLEVIRGNCKLKEKEKVNELIENFIKPFNLEKAPLIHAAIIELEDANVLAIDMHHIISDGVSYGIFTREFKDIYEGKELGDVKIQYKDFSEWQMKLERNGIIKKQEEYWLNKFKGELPILNLSTDYKRPQVQSFEGDRVLFELDEKLLDKLNEVLKSTGTTKHMLMLAAFNILLSKYSGQEDIIVGTPSAGRTHSDLDNAIGMFVNTLAIRNNLDGEMSFKEFLEEVKANTLRAFENQDYQLDELIEKLNVKRESGRNPLFDVMFIMQNLDIEEMKIGDLDIIPIEPYSKISKFDLSLMIAEEKDKTYGMIEYSTNLFKRESIERLQKHFENILESILEDIDIKLKDIELLSDIERQVLLKEFNDTKVNYPRHKSVKELFEEVVNESGDNIALSSNGIDLTYKELNEKANKIANFLIKKGTMNNNIIGILCDRSIETIVAILGVVKAGAVYMPIDKEYPKERIKYMLKDSKSNILLGQKNNFRKLNLEDVNVERIYIESEEIKNESIENPDIIILPEDLIYVIYTSGSTGRPKGVAVEHRGVVSLVKNTNHTKFREGYKYLKNISMSFDPSVLEIWGTLLNKMTLVVIKKEITMNIDKLGEVIGKEDIKVMNLPAPLFNSYAMENPKIFKGVECLQTGGDVLSPKAVSMVLKECKVISIVNGYGPTENTVTSTAYTINKSWDEGQEIPIGKPISNSTAYIMDKYNKLLPIGVIGELCVGGDGVARGYLNREELNKEKFIENPYVKGEKIYKTGDLAKMLPDGNIDFLGRIDNQVKIRGYRIELGEIEKELLKNEKIKEAVVIDRKDQGGNKYICAYVVAKSELNVDKIKEDIANELPIYMVPSHIVQLDSMPLNQNGKIDKKSLREVGDYIVEKYIPAQNEMQRNMEKVFAEVLGKDKVSIRSNFFDIGGDSIKSIQISSKLKKYSIMVEVKEIFKYKTIEEIYKHIKEKKIIAEQGTIEGIMSLTPVQRQLIESENEGFNNFNESRILYSKEGLKEDILKIVFTKIFNHHDVFRVIIKNEQGKTYLYNRGINEKLYDFYNYDLKNAKNLEKEIENKCNSIQQSIDIENGSIIKLALFKTKIGDYLSIFVHQFVIDEITWRIILEDLTNGYKALNEGKSFELPKKTTSFKEWSEKQNEYANNPKFLRELNYWEEVASQPVQNIPKKIEEGKIKDSNIVTVSLDKLKTKELLNKVNKAYDTETKDILISALSIATGKWTNLDKLGITLQGNGRENILQDVDVTRTAGCFTSYYPVVLDLDSEDIGKTIINTRDNLRSIPNKGIGYGMLKYLTRKNKEAINIDVITEISFNYLGKLDNNESNEEITTDALLQEKIIGNKFKLRDGINITSAISNDILDVNMTYDTEAYDEKSIKEFGELFINILNEIINYCRERDELEDSNIENIVLLKSSYRSKKNMFIIHDGTGNTLGYHEFVDGIDLYDYDIYGINFSSKYSQESNISIEKIASDYIDIIKKIQPQGPYYIFGWSLGGIIGLEMVKQLEQSGDMISKLIIADSYIVNTEAIDAQSEVAIAKNEFTSIKNQDKCRTKHYDIKDLSEKDRDIINKAMKEFEEDNGYSFKINKSFVNVMDKYNLGEPINSDIYFIQAEESSHWDLNKWENTTKGKFTYSKIPGNHLSIFQKPYVDILIEKFLNYIEE
ncbi:amino acid adenylation domain-containing protein, partial [Clostridium botulinum]|nr:amino acid adenylation domain-containing protein [Clostridium botulinum]